ncbi:Uncharacterised protein [Mycobacterium tuberculosis]|nr:Uncharacterised protein [Mycobacterium tuberculosis]
MSINSHDPASPSPTSGSARCCHPRVSSRSLTRRSRSSRSEVPVPMRSPRTANRTVPCSSSTSRSASPPRVPSLKALVNRV